LVVSTLSLRVALPIFDDAFLADDAVDGGVVLGAVDSGWSVAMATTGSERGLTLRSPGRFRAAVERLFELAGDRADVRDRLVDVRSEEHTSELQSRENL